MHDPTEFARINIVYHRRRFDWPFASKCLREAGKWDMLWLDLTTSESRCRNVVKAPQPLGPTPKSSQSIWRSNHAKLDRGMLARPVHRPKEKQTVARICHFLPITELEQRFFEVFDVCLKLLASLLLFGA
jgi:hypothetical protein